MCGLGRTLHICRMRHVRLWLRSQTCGNTCWATRATSAPSGLVRLRPILRLGKNGSQEPRRSGPLSIPIRLGPTPCIAFALWACTGMRRGSWPLQNVGKDLGIGRGGQAYAGFAHPVHDAEEQRVCRPADHEWHPQRAGLAPCRMNTAVLSDHNIILIGRLWPGNPCLRPDAACLPSCAATGSTCGHHCA